PGWTVRRVLLDILNGIVLVALVVGLVLAAGTAAGRVDPRLWALSSLDDRLAEIRLFYPNDVAYAVGDRLAFAERLVYWTAAFRTFSLFPVLGVGPGNTGFFFEQTLPTYGLRLTEIQAMRREPSYGFPNPKNLWTKLLSETGIVGFLLFSTWLLLMGVGSTALWRRGAGFSRVLGLAGLIAFVAQLIEGFSLDTFALPQLWLVFGLSTAAMWAAERHSEDAEPLGLHPPAGAPDPTPETGAIRDQPAV
ncbi:MAG TPA: O-antigen ligase family protein, partial [Anaerolineales bacterium]|nr:O-antigen ligase family protein [Anaerolineales bacterium]